jgi:DNA-directed RNA polymerase subunit E"
MVEKACKDCNRISEESECPICKSNEMTTAWKGLMIVYNEESQLAQEAEIQTPGKYAIRVKG